MHQRDDDIEDGFLNALRYPSQCFGRFLAAGPAFGSGLDSSSSASISSTVGSADWRLVGKARVSS